MVAFLIFGGTKMVFEEAVLFGKKYRIVLLVLKKNTIRLKNRTLF